MANLKESLELIKLLRIDVYMAFFMFAYGIHQIPNVELIQDKVCLNELERDLISCGQSSEEENNGLQSKVLSMATTIVNYQVLVATLPGVVQSFFFGYWIDKYPSHIRFLLVLPCFGLLIQSLIMVYQTIFFQIEIIYSLWAYLALGLSGGMSLVLAASFSYAAKKTPQKFRSIRFAIVDLFIFTAYPMGLLAGGKILASKSWFESERRNFSAVYITSTVLMILAILWAIFIIDDSGLKNGKSTNQKAIPITTVSAIPSASTSTEETPTPMTEVNLNEDKNANTDKATNVQSGGQKSSYMIANDIFNFKNVSQTIRTFLRERPNKDRTKVVLLTFCVLTVYISLISEGFFGFQYTEKSFLWDYQYYSNMYACLQLVQSFGTIAGSMFLKNTMKLADPEVAAIGTLSHLLGNLIKGLPLVSCYIAGSLTFCLSGIAIPAIRSCLTRIIDFNEIGQILSIISCMQAIGPLIASTQTSFIFKATIDTAPGTTYHFLAASLVPTLIILTWVSLVIDAQENAKKLSTKVRFEVDNAKELVEIQGLGDNNTNAIDKV